MTDNRGRAGASIDVRRGHSTADAPLPMSNSRAHFELVAFPDAFLLFPFRKGKDEEGVSRVERCAARVPHRR